MFSDEEEEVEEKKTALAMSFFAAFFTEKMSEAYVNNTQPITIPAM